MKFISICSLEWADWLNFLCWRAERPQAAYKINGINFNGARESSQRQQKQQMNSLLFSINSTLLIDEREWMNLFVFDWRKGAAASHQPNNFTKSIKENKINFISLLIGLLFELIVCFAAHSPPIKFINNLLHFSSFINHFFICWRPTNLKKWIDWREWRVDEFNGAASCRKARQFYSFHQLAH